MRGRGDSGEEGAGGERVRAFSVGLVVLGLVGLAFPPATAPAFPPATAPVIPPATAPVIPPVTAPPVSALSSPADTTEGVAEVDVESVLSSARAAQRRFERERRRNLPRTGSPSPPCDRIIGRFCIWFGYDDDRELPPERLAVEEARRRLLEELDAAAAAAPAEPWIAGQRVRYLAEAGRLGEALEAARECRAPDPGWCAFLVGFARHAAGDFQGAEASFAGALSRLSPEERCRWEDLGLLLDGAGRRSYGELPCGGRAEFEERFWWLADPLYLVPGNDRKTEHYWRLVMDRLQEGAASPFGVRWGADLREILLRYGWPVGWRAQWPRPGLVPSEPSVIAYEPPGIRQFVSRGEWIADPGGIEAGAWDLKPVRPRSHYAAPYAGRFGSLEHQVARFRRGDSMVVVAAFDVSEGAAEPCDSLVQAAVLAHGPERTAVRRRSGTGDAGSLTVSHPRRGEAVLFGLEALCPSQKRAARVRYGLQEPRWTGPAISDLLLGREVPGSPPPTTLEEAAASARGVLRVRRGEQVPVYWEVYDVAAAAPATVVVTLAREGKGFFRRLGEWAGLARDREASVGLRWRERAGEGPTWSRAVAVAVPGDLPEGTYRLDVTLLVGPGTLLHAGRALEVKGDAPDASNGSSRESGGGR